MVALAESLDLTNTANAYHAAASVVGPNTSLIHVSGQPGNTKSGHVPEDYESQIHLALLNIRMLAIAAGTSTQNLAKLCVYIVNYDPSQRKHPRHIQRLLAGHRPAMTLVPVAQLAVPGWLIEIEATIARTQPTSVPRPISFRGPREAVDVVIIGAGLAGLTAAHEALRAGLSCVVVEARDRVGGKTWSHQLPDGKGIVELGAAWINDSNQVKMYGLAKQFGAELIEQNTTGNVALQDTNGRFSSFPYGELPRFDTATVKEVARIRDMCEADCQALDIFLPKDMSLDSLTFEAYLKSRGATGASLETATVWTRAMLGQEPGDISALFFLNYCKSGGGLLQMRSDRKDGGQHLRVRQGTQFFSLKLAESLPADVVRLSMPVTSVTVEGPQSVVVRAKNTTFAARKVITTVPSPVLKTISFMPSLPPSKQLWSESAGYGYYTKAMMVFRTPFWIKKGFCGLVNSFTGPAAVIRDTSSPADDKHVLTCFMASDFGRQWSALSTRDRELRLLEQIGGLFGAKNEAKSEFVELICYEWTKDEYSGGGCPCAALSPGVLDRVGGNALRESWGNVHFAGTETAGEWKGYMEGAVRSGERAAAEVIKDLKAGVIAKL